MISQWMVWIPERGETEDDARQIGGMDAEDAAENRADLCRCGRMGCPVVDLDELDRLHAALPELCDRVEEDMWSPTVFAVIAEVQVTPRLAMGVEMGRHDAGIVMGKAATNAVTLLRAYPALAAEVRALRALRDDVTARCGNTPACRYRPAEVTHDGKAITVMNSADCHRLGDALEELHALREVVDAARAFVPTCEETRVPDGGDEPVSCGQRATHIDRLSGHDLGPICAEHDACRVERKRVKVYGGPIGSWSAEPHHVAGPTRYTCERCIAGETR